MEGTKIGSYRLTRKLGEGGMGAVYLAESESLSTRKAVKVLLAELSADPTMMARFRSEAQAVADLQHDNIIGIDEFSQLPNGQWFIMMPFLEGASLFGFLMSRGPLGVHLTLHILAQVGAALHAAHAQGFVHRDLKPENVFITSRHSNPHLVKLLDFGIAKNTRRSPDGQRTANGTVLGTPVYMAAEQYENAATVDARADIFSLGVLAYVMLSGQYPFGAPTENWMALYNRQRYESPEPLPSHVPSRVQRVIYRALAYSPASRPQSAQELVVELALGTPDDPMEPSGIEIVRQVTSELLMTGPASETTRNPHAAELARALWPRLGSTPAPVPVSTPAPPAASSYAVATAPPAVTTLSAASGPVPMAMPTAAPARSRAPFIAAGAVLIAGAVGVIVMVTRSDDVPAPARPAASPVDAAPARATAPVPQPLPAASPPDARSLRSIVIETVPRGIDLVIDGRPAGASPVTIERPLGASVTVRAERHGYRAETETLTITEATTRVELRLSSTSSRLRPEDEPAPKVKPDASPKRETFNPDDVVGN
jgi:serine/threonine protein kinase